MESFEQTHKDALSRLIILETEYFFGDIIGDGNKVITARNTIDYCSSDDEDGENEYVLELSIFKSADDNNDGPYQLQLELQNNVHEVGIEDKHLFKTTNLESMSEELDKLILEWDMSVRYAYSNGVAFLKAIFSFVEYLESNGVKFKWSA